MIKSVNVFGCDSLLSFEEDVEEMEEEGVWNLLYTSRKICWTLKSGSSQIGKVVIKRKEVHHCTLKFKV